jgi:quinolinate synthase
MKQITLAKVRDTLRDLAPTVEIPADVAAKARVAIDRMLAIHA